MGRFLDFISGKSVPNEVVPEPQVEETVEISEPIEEKKTNFFNLNSGKKKRKRK
jgi:hypothetical protein